MSRLHSEHVALLAGLLLLVFAAWQASQQRAFELFVIGGLALVILSLFRHQLRHLKVGTSGIDLAVDQALRGETQATDDQAVKEIAEQLNQPSQAPHLKLLIASALPFGYAETLMGTDHAVQLTAVNTSASPLGVDSLALAATGGNQIPVTDAIPTEHNIRLPAVLQPQQKASTWVDRVALRNVLREHDVRLEAIVAHMADGTTVREPVPDDWRRLGDPDSE